MRPLGPLALIAALLVGVCWLAVRDSPTPNPQSRAQPRTQSRGEMWMCQSSQPRSVWETSEVLR